MKIEIGSLGRKEVAAILGRVVVPLPVVLITTVGEDGINNAAPFSLVCPINWNPPIILVSIGPGGGGHRKQTLRNIEFSHEFVVNIMDDTLIKSTIQASADYRGVDKIKEVGLTPIAADKVKPPRVAEAQVNLECLLMQKMELRDGKYFRSLVFGEVVLAHVKDELLVNNKIEPSRLRAMGWLASGAYCRTRDIVGVTAPKDQTASST